MMCIHAMKCACPRSVFKARKNMYPTFFFSFFLFYSFSSNAYQPGLNAYESGGSEQKVPDPNQV